MNTGTPASTPGPADTSSGRDRVPPEAEATRSWRPPADQSDRTQRKDW